MYTVGNNRVPSNLLFQIQKSKGMVCVKKIDQFESMTQFIVCRTHAPDANSKLKLKYRYTVFNFIDLCTHNKYATVAPPVYTIVFMVICVSTDFTRCMFILCLQYFVCLQEDDNHYESNIGTVYLPTAMGLGIQPSLDKN